MSLRHMAVADYIYTELIRQTDLSSHIQTGGIVGRGEEKGGQPRKCERSKESVFIFLVRMRTSVEQSF